MNKVILMGRLTRDVEVRYSQSGTAFARVGIAVERPFSKDKAAAPSDDRYGGEPVDDEDTPF